MTASNRAAVPLPRRRVRVLDSEIDYVDIGHGKPIVFLHGNPTSSYLWRNIIPRVADLGRCLAPDLVGMGRSGKSPAGEYRFRDHVCYLDAWFDALQLTGEVVLVLHDWGSALGFYRAQRYPSQIAAIAYMEALALPLRWDDFDPPHREVFQALRTEKGSRMVLDDNFFVEVVLPRGVIRPLSADEMAAYRAPFHEREARLPTLVWPRELPIEGEPADVHAIVESYSTWFVQSRVPKLLILSEPGAIVRDRVRDFCRSLPNQTEVTVKGRHFLQEDSPDEVADALSSFVKHVREVGASALARSEGSSGAAVRLATADPDMAAPGAQPPYQGK